LLNDEAKVFSDRMFSIKGNRICFVETKDAPHDIILAGHLSGFVKEAEDAANDAGDVFGL
jgi:hypothetical protein